MVEGPVPLHRMFLVRVSMGTFESFCGIDVHIRGAFSWYIPAWRCRRTLLCSSTQVICHNIGCLSNLQWVYICFVWGSRWGDQNFPFPHTWHQNCQRPEWMKWVVSCGTRGPAYSRVRGTRVVRVLGIISYWRGCLLEVGPKQLFAFRCVSCRRQRALSDHIGLWSIAGIGWAAFSCTHSSWGQLWGRNSSNWGTCIWRLWCWWHYSIGVWLLWCGCSDWQVAFTFDEVSTCGNPNSDMGLLFEANDPSKCVRRCIFLCMLGCPCGSWQKLHWYLLFLFWCPLVLILRIPFQKLFSTGHQCLGCSRLLVTWYDVACDWMHHRIGVIVHIRC